MSLQERAKLLKQQLISLGILSAQDLEKAQAEQSKTHERFGVVLCRMGLIRDPESAKRFCAKLGWLPERVEISGSQEIDLSGPQIEFCKTFRLAPVKREQGILLIAIDDPLAIFSADLIESQLGARVNFVLVTENNLNELLLKFSDSPKSNAKAPSTAGASIESKDAHSDEPIIRLVDSMCVEAVRLRASDIHLEPRADGMRIRYRVDGVLRDANTTPRALHGPVIGRLKIMAGLNIAEKRLPQDGRMQISASGAALDVRVSMLPALHGEAVVMRLLDRARPEQGLSELGMLEDDEKRWNQLIKRPYGMVLVTGPTGSGKTTTLYTTLSFLNRPEKKLITVEDPVEYQLPGVNQVQVRPLIGLTFASGLRSMLRQAPDVIMVGEIRDSQTAQIAVQAALTGHLVLSTLHTNDAPSAITRLIDMGIAPFLVASTLQGVLAQRLIRRLCASCKKPRASAEEERIFLGDASCSQVYEAVGCDKCNGSGYSGRVGIYELLCLDDALRGMVVAKKSASVLRRQAQLYGMRSLRSDGAFKVRQGVSTVSEIIKATPEEIA